LSTQLEDTAKDFITQNGWLHNRRIAVSPV
jgi:hypothetical protein